MGALLDLCKPKREYIDDIYFEKPIIFSLSNPAGRYTFTRHNVGRLFVDFMAWKYGIDDKWKKNTWGEFIETCMFDKTAAGSSWSAFKTCSRVIILF